MKIERKLLKKRSVKFLNDFVYRVLSPFWQINFTKYTNAGWSSESVYKSVQKHTTGKIKMMFMFYGLWQPALKCIMDTYYVKPKNGQK